MRMFRSAMRRGNVLGRMRERLTYGNVMATVALFVGLGGTSYALTLPKKSVGSRELKMGAVRSVDIKDRTIAVRDIAKSTRRSLRGATGPIGPTGPQGPSGVTLFAIVDSAGSPIAPPNVGSTQDGINGRVITFQRSIAGCAYSA